MNTSSMRVHDERPSVAEKYSFTESKGLEETLSVWRMVPEVVRLTSGAQTMP
jgi:hypothetical protein